MLGTSAWGYKINDMLIASGAFYMSCLEVHFLSWEIVDDPNSLAAYRLSLKKEINQNLPNGQTG